MSSSSVPHHLLIVDVLSPPYRLCLVFVSYPFCLPFLKRLSSSRPLSLSHHPPSPLCPDTCSPWRWWTGSAPRGMTGTTTAHRGTTRVTEAPRTWTRTSVLRWEPGREKPMAVFATIKSPVSLLAIPVFHRHNIGILWTLWIIFAQNL